MIDIRYFLTRLVAHFLQFLDLIFATKIELNTAGYEVSLWHY